ADGQPRAAQPAAPLAAGETLRHLAQTPAAAIRADPFLPPGPAPGLDAQATPAPATPGLLCRYLRRLLRSAVSRGRRSAPGAQRFGRVRPDGAAQLGRGAAGVRRR